MHEVAATTEFYETSHNKALTSNVELDMAVKFLWKIKLLKQQPALFNVSLVHEIVSI